MTIPQAITELTTRLLEATQQGKVEWTPVDATSFSIETARGTISLRSRDADGVGPFVFSIYNDDGIEVESYTTHRDEAGPAWSMKVEQLFDAARRQSLGVDDVIKGIEEELGLGDDSLPF
jgi:hypothetical protein